jgi:hypothetical protein
MFVKKPIGKQPLRRLRKDNTKVNLSEIAQEDGMWKQLAQDYVQWQILVLTVVELSNPTDPRVDSASNRNENQESSWE